MNHKHNKNNLNSHDIAEQEKLLSELVENDSSPSSLLNDSLIIELISRDCLTKK